MARRIRLTSPKGAVEAREPDEENRVSTSLELFFDLCFVVAVGQAGAQLAHAVGHGEVAHGLASYVAAFFAVWWPWMNYSWFASAFDPDDIPFRLATFVQIFGSLVIAAGVPQAFQHHDYRQMVVGYVVLRLAFASQWLRVYRDNVDLRALAVCWGGGVLVVQALWVALQFERDVTVFQTCFFALALAEMALPYLAGRAGEMPWHPHHIAERYGLFTLIVLGETVSAATVAVQEAMADQDDIKELTLLAVGGLLIVFSAWWIYFAEETGDLLVRQRSIYPWAYGHYFVFGSAAMIGAGIEVGAGWTTDTDKISAILAAAATTVPTAIFLLVVWVLQARHFKRGAAQAVMPGTAAAVLLCTFAGGYAVIMAGLCCAVATGIGTVLVRRRPAAGATGLEA